MPNHVSNLVHGPSSLDQFLIKTVEVVVHKDECYKLHAKRVAELAKEEQFDLIFNEPDPAYCACVPYSKDIVDFELLVPMPDILKSGSASLMAEKMARDVLLTDPSVITQEFTDQFLETLIGKDVKERKLVIQYLKAFKETGGHVNWYYWSINNWGTKWNAYDYDEYRLDGIYFETAWSAPHPVIEKLAEMAKVDFVHEWADEDTGSNVGRRIYRPDGTYLEELLDGTPEAYELNLKLRPHLSERLGKVNGIWMWLEDVEFNEEAHPCWMKETKPSV